MGLLAAVSAIHSDLPASATWPLAGVSVIYGTWLARRESRKAPRQLVIGDEARISIDEVAVTGFTVHWRGPLAFAHWLDADGCRQRLVWWPDTLPAAARRELRLAVPAQVTARHTGSMAT